MSVSAPQTTVHVSDGLVRVRLGRAFRAEFPLSSVASARPDKRRVLSLGVHGWRGRWLVNTSWRDLVTITLEPPARARVLGIPVRVDVLTVSAADPAALVATLDGVPAS